MSSDSTAGARALASRRNGARSRGPRTAAGKARSARNALKHGLCAQKIVVLPEEDAAAFKALEAALLEELAPVGTLQAVLAQRIVSAAWRLARADRIEAEVLVERRYKDGGLGLALIRDTTNSRTFDTLLRYRGAATAEFMRALRTLKTLQAETHALADVNLPAAAPARRRRWLAQRKEPENIRQNNTLTAGPSAAPHDGLAQNLPDAAPATLPSTAPRTKESRESAPNQAVALRAPRQSPHDTPDALYWQRGDGWSSEQARCRDLPDLPGR